MDEVYLNEKEGRVEVQAPQAVVDELETEPTEPLPLYRRILLGDKTEAFWAV